MPMSITKRYRARVAQSNPWQSWGAAAAVILLLWLLFWPTHPACIVVQSLLLSICNEKDNDMVLHCLLACLIAPQSPPPALSLTRKTHNIKWNAVRFNYRKIFYNCDTVLSRSLCMVGRSPARTIYRLNIAPQFYVLSSTDTAAARATAAKAAFH